ncbi:site-specific DNA-methyltransferase [bacterium]|nr:MAG: site-specific DNA-methyltransferase [bacterium]
MKHKMIDDFINKIFNTTWENTLPQIPDNSIDIVITSPPYNVSLGDNKFRDKSKGYDIYDDNMPYEDYLAWMDKLYTECYRVLKPGGRICINIGDGANGSICTHADFTVRMRDKAGFIPITTLVWDKKQIGASCLYGDELINTSGGYKEIRDICVGDSVLTHKRRFKKVTEVFHRKYTGYMYRIKSNLCEDVVVTGGHPLLLSPLHRKCGKYHPKKCVTREDNYWEIPEKISGENYLVCPRYSKMKVGSYHGFYRIKSVEKEWVNDVDVYNMEVEEDHSYVGKIAYHNCAWGSYQSPSCPSFPTQFEFIIVMGKETKYHKGDKEKITVGGKEFQRNSRALWAFPPETQMMKEYGHPAMFPSELPRRLIQQLTYEDDIVYDPFNGVGTTCVVAKQLNRRYIGTEMSKKYYETSLVRLGAIPTMIKTKSGEEVPEWMV